MGYKTIALAVLMGGSLGVVVPAQTNDGPAGQPVFTRTAVRHYRVTHEVTLTPVDRNPFSRIALVLPVPGRLPHQQVQGEPTVLVWPLRTKPQPLRTKNPHFTLAASQPFEQPVLKIDLDRPAVQREWKVSLQYEVDVSNLVFDLEKVRQVEFRQLSQLAPLMAIYLRPETLVESDHPEVRAALAEVFPEGISATAPAYDTAWTIFEWVLAHSTYQLNAERGRARKLWGALDLLRTGRGECGDYSALFVALCRAAGIPARSQVGFWVKKDSSPHVWAEFYLPGVGWIPADPASSDDAPHFATRWFGNLPDLNRRITVTLAFDHQVADLKMDCLQNLACRFWYEGKPATLQASYRFLAE